MMGQEVLVSLLLDLGHSDATRAAEVIREQAAEIERLKSEIKGLAVKVRDLKIDNEDLMRNQPYG